MTRLRGEGYALIVLVLLAGVVAAVAMFAGVRGAFDVPMLITVLIAIICLLVPPLMIGFAVYGAFWVWNANEWWFVGTIVFVIGVFLWRASIRRRQRQLDMDAAWLLANWDHLPPDRR